MYVAIFDIWKAPTLSSNEDDGGNRIVIATAENTYIANYNYNEVIDKIYRVPPFKTSLKNIYITVDQTNGKGIYTAATAADVFQAGKESVVISKYKYMVKDIGADPICGGGLE